VNVGGYHVLIASIPLQGITHLYQGGTSMGKRELLKDAQELKDRDFLLTKIMFLLSPKDYNTISF
jgi:hypothetical protein